MSGHCGNTIQGQARRECRRDHLSCWRPGHGRPLDRGVGCWLFRGPANSAWGHGERAGLWQGLRHLLVQVSRVEVGKTPVRSEICPWGWAGSGAILTLANTASLSQETEASSRGVFS